MQLLPNVIYNILEMSDILSYILQVIFQHTFATMHGANAIETLHHTVNYLAQEPHLVFV